MECKVCLEIYDESQRRPHNLPCGHTFCTICIEDMLQNSSLTCPRCRAKHIASDRSSFPVAYDLEEVLSKRESSTSAALGRMLHSQKKDISSKINTLRDEQMASINNISLAFQEKISQLDKYKTKLIDWGIEHDDLIHKIQKDLIEQNEELRDSLKEEHGLVAEVLEAGETQEQQLKFAKESLFTAQTTQDVFVAINDAEIVQSEAESWIEKCDELFQDAKPVHRSIKVRAATRKAMRMVRHETNLEPAITLRDVDGMSSSSRGVTPATISSVHNVCSFDIPIGGAFPLTVDNGVRCLLQAGKVFAVIQEQCRTRSARITLQHDRVYLHHLRKQNPPMYAQTLQYADIEEQLNTSSPTAFLDLAWPGSPPQRIHIQLSPNQRALQFSLLCTGKNGPSYAYTHLIEVYRKGEAGERISGGDYDGEGGAALIQGLPWGGIYSRPASSGIVFSWSDDNIGGRFGILTRGNAGCYNGVFGQVVSGLDVLRSIVELSDITRVTVIDCGIVLSQ
ncbi:uncharacterized protein LOC122248556 isoform X2 [Penaeus japonicus]|uniref:uncharacterized protein LOC122248556 isoform X2 n=1 Tax=Penaeus japonicus TaxID=27405 RepID=UPI001C71050D|nr:uncharacterized protein LOC122248556 isoform X2 [Penaeus japonicus]